MAQTIHVISPHEEQALQAGEKPNCREHRHVSKDDAFEMTSDAGLRPWLKLERHSAQYRWARNADETVNKKYIVCVEAYEWRKTKELSTSGGIAMSTMQFTNMAGRGV